MALDRQQVIDEALRLLDDDGLDALSLRTLASRLSVQAPTLYWHIGSKSELLDALADAIVDEAITALPPSDRAVPWTDWLLDALVGLRAALLSHRDGARVVSGSRSSLRRADFSEAVMSALVDRGVDPAEARLTVLAGERAAVGYVLEEQAPVDESRTPPDVEELKRRFPIMTEAITTYFATGNTPDDLYRDVIRRVLA